MLTKNVIVSGENYFRIKSTGPARTHNNNKN